MITVKVMISTNVKMINQKRLNVVWMSILHKENQSLSYYRSKGLVHDIQGNQDINDVFSDIEKVLSNLK